MIDSLTALITSHATELSIKNHLPNLLKKDDLISIGMLAILEKSHESPNHNKTYLFAAGKEAIRQAIRKETRRNKTHPTYYIEDMPINFKKVMGWPHDKD